MSAVPADLRWIAFVLQLTGAFELKILLEKADTLSAGGVFMTIRWSHVLEDRGDLSQRAELWDGVAGQDMTETVFEETEVAKTVREIRARDSNFDMVRFLRNLKQDIQPVIQVSTLHHAQAPPIHYLSHHRQVQSWWMGEQRTK